MNPHRWRELLLGFSAALGWVYAASDGVSVSKLPVLDLNTGGEEIQSTTKVPCSVGWIPTNALTGGLVNTNSVGTLKAQVKFHGASSQAYEKKSFALSLDAPTPWLGLHSTRQWVLNAAYIDCSMMRHKLSYDLFQSLASPENKRPASSSRFVEVMLNGHYHGAYLLMERVDGSLLGFAPKGRPSKIPGVIYKAIDHEANFRQSGHTGYEQREPNPEERELWTPLDELNQFVSESTDADFFNEKAGIDGRLDTGNAIDFHLLVLLTSNMDGIDKNFILGRDAVTEARPHPKFFFVPWDYDATFGRNWEGSPVEPTFWLSNNLFDRLLSNPGYRQKHAARWNSLRQRQFSVENLHRMIDENVRVFGPAAQRNEKRWSPIRGNDPGSLAFTEDVAQMKDWVVARTRWLDAVIDRETRTQP